MFTDYSCQNPPAVSEQAHCSRICLVMWFTMVNWHITYFLRVICAKDSCKRIVLLKVSACGVSVYSAVVLLRDRM